MNRVFIHFLRQVPWLSLGLFTESGDKLNSEDMQLVLIRVMPYGKYKGRVIADLPGNYLNWFAREGFPAGEIGRLLALMHEIDHNGLRPLLEPLRTSTP